MKETILALPDLQAPFHHPDTLPFLRAVKKKYKPTQVVNIGDEIDMHALSDYPSDPDGLGAGDELEEALKFMRKLYKLFPEVKVCTSNHTSRPFRRAFKSGLPKAFIRDYREFLDAPSTWSWADSWEIEDIIFEHGEAYSGQQAAIKHALANLKSTVIGHHHSQFSITYVQTPSKQIFGVSTGCLIDDDAYCFAYNKKQKSRPILGCVIIKEGVPMLIPMKVNKKNKWTGKL